MEVLVTGGAGFIGSHIVDKLIEEGHEVRILDNLEPQVHGDLAPDYLNERAEFIKGDIRDTNAILKAIEGVEVIFHEAAAVSMGQSMYQVEKFMDVNTLGTAKLLDVLIGREHDVKKLVVASSMSIYGEGAYLCDDCGIVYPSCRSEKPSESDGWEMRCPGCGKGVSACPTTEKKPLDPSSVYAISKRDQEELCLSVGRAYGLPTVALRYFNVYGPRQSLSNPYTGVCAIFSSRIRNNNPPMIFEDGHQSRDFVSVHDIVQANLLAMKSSSADYNAFNVGSGEATSILDVARALIKLYDGGPDPKILCRFRKGDIRHIYADISKIKAKIGYSPRVKFQDGMRELVGWTREKESVDKFSRSYDELLTKGLVSR